MDLLSRSSFFGFEANVIEEIRGLPIDCYYLLSNGSFIDIDEIKINDVFQINFRLIGGKGGFGSVLRSFRISKSTNNLMCRDLNGRRIGDVKHEANVQKWNAKKAEREKEKERKKKEKYDKLKQGGPKHKFDNVDYLRTRDLMLDQTEDAIEAALAESTLSIIPPKIEPAAGTSKEADSSDDSDLEMDFMVVKKAKRKLAQADKIETKKPKLEIIEEVAVKETPVVIQQETIKEEPVKVKSEPIPVEAIDYPEINLKDFKNADELLTFELGHLKHALENRGLKCGGTLEQRAERLFSVKGLKPKKYPKKLLAAKN